MTNGITVGTETLELPLEIESPFRIIQCPEEKIPTAVLTIDWGAKPKFRPLPGIDESMQVKDQNGQVMPFSLALCNNLDRLFIVWRDLPRNDVAKFAADAIAAGQNAVDVARFTYAKFMATSPEVVLLARATELFLNCVRTVDALQDALLDFQRQPNFVTKPKHRRAVLDRNLAGMVSLRTDAATDIVEIEDYRKHAATENPVVDIGIIAQMLRTTEENALSMKAHILDNLRNAAVSEGAVDEDEQNTDRD